MRHRGWPIACAAVLWAGNALAAFTDGPAGPTFAPPLRSPTPDDFKLKIDVFGVGKIPNSRAELIVRRGVAYQFLSNSPEEVLILDPSSSRVALLDLQRKIRTEVPSKKLDAHLGTLFKRVSVAVESRAKSGTRADRVSSAMSRDLIEPKFQETFDAESGKLRLANPTVEVDAVGVPDEDGPRVALIVKSLYALTKLGSYREPDQIPPFTRLEVLRRLCVAHRLRPTEITFVYRLAGPPQKLRWTFELVPNLTDREIEAISRVDRFRGTSKLVPYEFYEADEQG